MLAGQEKIRTQLEQLHNVISGKNMTYAEIVKSRSIDPDISLLHATELSGMVPSGLRVSVEKYGILGDMIDYGTANKT